MTTPTSATSGVSPTAPEPTSSLRAPLLAAIGSVAVITVSGVVIGWSSLSSVQSGGEVFRIQGDPQSILMQILAKNFAAALLIFSGYATMGLTSALGLLFTSTYVGATFHAMVAAQGISGINHIAWIYIPFEFVGLLVVAVAGFLPVCRVLLGWLADFPPPRPGQVTRRCLQLAGAGFALILTGALIETVVIIHSS